MGNAATPGIRELIEISYEEVRETILSRRRLAEAEQAVSVPIVVPVQQYERHVAQIRGHEITSEDPFPIPSMAQRTPDQLDPSKNHHASLYSAFVEPLWEVETRTDLGKTHVQLDMPLYGSSQNHFPFLEFPVLERLLLFIESDQAFAVMLAACPHWFVTLHDYVLNRQCRPLLMAFHRYYGKWLRIQEATISSQPIFCTNSAIRTDLLIYAKIDPSLQNKNLSVGYSFSYCRQTAEPGGTGGHEGSPSHRDAASEGTSPNNQKSPICRHKIAAILPKGMDSDGAIAFPVESCYGTRNTSKTQFYNAFLQANVMPRGSRRHLWILHDNTRFHGDELMVATSSQVATACVGDILEIGVNLSNGFGVVDVNFLRWLPPVVNSGVLCASPPNFETTVHDVWIPLDRYQETSSERLEEADFGPQWKLTSATALGIDISVARLQYKAASPGPVASAQERLGLSFCVKSTNEPITVAMKRRGMTHDRFTMQQCRVGDVITLFRSIGGLMT